MDLYDMNECLEQALIHQWTLPSHAIDVVNVSNLQELIDPNQQVLPFIEEKTSRADAFE